MTDGERIAVLETQMRTTIETMQEMVKDVKTLQIRWGMFFGAIALVTNLPGILSLFGRH